MTSGGDYPLLKMGSKRKKPNPSIDEEKSNGPPLPLPLPATSEEEEFRRNWSGLPELALHYIFRRLVSIPDILSFSSVCTSWNSLTSSSTSPTDLSASFPPLLLLPVLNLQNPNPSFSLRAHRSPTWSRPPRCRLQTLETLGRSFQPKIPPRTLALPFLGYSNGHLIFNLSKPPFLLLANVFSGQTTRIPFPFPAPLSPFPRIALLTDTDLLLASDSLILSYHRATGSWSQLNHGAASFAVSRDTNHLFSIDGDATNLRAIEFPPAASDATPTIRSRPMQVPSPQLSEPFLCNRFAHRLVDRGGDLLLLRFVLFHIPPWVRWRVNVFKLDPEGSKWAEAEGLGDWCLFVDTVGSCVAACPEPGMWGGRSNCVYVTGPGCDGWVLVPVDGDRRFTISEPSMTLLWPSPVWVYPTDKVKMIRGRLRIAQDRQKHWTDNSRRPLEFEAGDSVFVRISPTRGTIRFGRAGKFSRRYIGPFEVLSRVGEVAYRVALPSNLEGVHNVFHVSQLRRYIPDPSHILDHSELEIGPGLTVPEQPVEILDRTEKRLRNMVIPLVRVTWRHHSPDESTWEREADMKEKYPHLF